MERKAFEELSNDKKWEYLESLIKGNKPIRPYFPPATIVRCKPNWISPLYVNIPFPHYKNKDHTTIELDDDNIFNGTLNDKDDTDEVIMRWEGYVSQSRDGELKLSPIINYDKPCFIQGKCNGFDFRFEDTELIYGVWPGFLHLYGQN